MGIELACSKASQSNILVIPIRGMSDFAKNRDLGWGGKMLEETFQITPYWHACGEK